MPDIDPRHLATLETVVRAGSFAAAARELGYTQSAVSQQIAELERRVGLRVLERRPVRATEAGAILLAAGTTVHEVLAAAIVELDALRDGSAGRVRLGAFASAAGSIVPLALARLRAGNPDIYVTLMQLEADASYARLMRGDLDLGLTFDYDKVPLPAPAGLRRTLIARDPVVVALPARHRLARSDVVDLTSLAGEAWIAAPQAGMRLDLLSTLAETAGFTPRLQYEGDDFQTVLSLVANGLAVALLPRLALHRPMRGVAIRPLTGAPLTRFLYTARLDTRHTARAVTTLEGLLAAIAAELVRG